MQNVVRAFYVSSGRSLKALSNLCQGSVDYEGNPLVDASVLPWSSMGKSSIKPSAVELGSEVLRRCMIDSNILTAPRPKAWTIARSTEWLNEQPITGDDDIAFIKNMITERIRAAERVTEEHQ